MNHYFNNMDNPTVLFFSEVNWDYLRQRHHFFSEEYSKNHSIYYFGKIGLRYPKARDLFNILFKKNNRKKFNISNSKINFPSFFFLPPINFLFNVMNKKIFLNKYLSRFLKINEIIIHFYQPTKLIFDIINFFKKHGIKIKVVYDCVQDYRFHPSTNSELISFENKLVKLADLVVADSKINYDRLKGINSKLLVVQPGVETSNFFINPKKIKNSTVSIIYYGNIRQDLDFELLNGLSYCDNIKITLLGNLNYPKNKLSKKIILKDAIPYKKLKTEIEKHDAVILPYMLNDFTSAIIPAKFFECLATNMPIISTSMKATKKYHHLLYLIDKNSLPINIKKLNDTVSTSNLKERNEIIKNKSWKEKFNEFYNEI